MKIRSLLAAAAIAVVPVAVAVPGVAHAYGCQQFYQASGSLHRNATNCSGLPAGYYQRAYIGWVDGADVIHTSYGACVHGDAEWSYTPYKAGVYTHGWQVFNHSC